MKKIWFRVVSTTVAAVLTATIGFAAEPAAKPAAVKTEAAKPVDAKKQPLVDINSASDTELKAVQGLDDAQIAKIISGRPYAVKTQLVSRKIIPAPVYEKIKDRIVAKQPKKDDKVKTKAAAPSQEQTKK